MATRKNTKKSKQTHISTFSPEMQNIFAGIISLAIGLLVFFSTQSNNGNELPTLGKLLQNFGFFLFGEPFRLIFAPILILFGALLLVRRSEWNTIKLLGILGFYISATSLFGAFWSWNTGMLNIFPETEQLFGVEFSIITYIALLLFSLYIIFGISYTKILSHMHFHTREAIQNIRTNRYDDEDEEIIETPKRKAKAKQIDRELEEIQEKKKKTEKAPTDEVPMWAKILKQIFTKNSEDEDETGENTVISKNIKKLSFIRADKRIQLVDASSGEKIEPKIEEKKEKIKVSKNISLGKWQFPSLDILNKPKKQNPISPEEIREKALIIQKTLLQFGIEVEMAQECVGPTVIQYRLRPAEGIKVSKIENLNKDLALALGAKSIRIQAPIPGMQLVGIEVPNDKRDVISIREVLADKNFTHHKAKLAIALGKDINGEFVVSDLAKMPHLLIAGQTGSGKSVGMNGLILSLLYKNTPAELQMIMVDPKQVELGMYDGIPHLLTPVITSPDKALNSLRWSVAEMERRFNLMREKRVKNLEEYNEKVDEKEKMPAIVFIIDELADLMMSGNKKEVEHNIARIAQKGRAAGMHIIIATQRPSVNVITGIIKANIPTRIAFTVASQIDSRTILDQMGAESLLGRGDMLYFPTGAMGPTRVQGMLVETDEIDRVVRDIRLTILPEDWSPNIPETDTIVQEPSGNRAGSIIDGQQFDESEEVINAAIELVQSAGKCSTSMLQRHLKLGYGRAARVVDILEEMGVVGPADGSKPREVL